MKFPNGFESWHETHFEISKEIGAIANLDSPYGAVLEQIDKWGTGGLYDLSKELTDKFEKEHKDKEWDGDYFDTIEEFIGKELK